MNGLIVSSLLLKDILLSFYGGAPSLLLFAFVCFCLLLFQSTIVSFVRIVLIDLWTRIAALCLIVSNLFADRLVCFRFSQQLEFFVRIVFVHSNCSIIHLVSFIL